MSIFIKCMDMPKSCRECLMWVNDPDIGMCCGITRSAIDMIAYHHCRLSDCPIVEVKVPHGRLKDVDALFEEGADVCVGTYNALEEQGFSYAKIVSMPTIIEAEGENNG